MNTTNSSELYRDVCTARAGVGRTENATIGGKAGPFLVCRSDSIEIGLSGKGPEILIESDPYYIQSDPYYKLCHAREIELYITSQYSALTPLFGAMHGAGWCIKIAP